MCARAWMETIIVFLRSKRECIETHFLLIKPSTTASSFRLSTPYSPEGGNAWLNRKSQIIKPGSKSQIIKSQRKRKFKNYETFRNSSPAHPSSGSDPNLVEKFHTIHSIHPIILISKISFLNLTMKLNLDRPNQHKCVYQNKRWGQKGSFFGTDAQQGLSTFGLSLDKLVLLIERSINERKRREQGAGNSGTSGGLHQSDLLP